MDSTVLDVGSNSQPAAVDWNGDGKKDLLLGSELGYVYVYPNQTDDSWPMFQACETLRAAGAYIYLNRVNPYVFDLDRDGVHDLICGANDGYIRFYKNNGSNEVPELAAAETLKLLDGTPILAPGNRSGSRCGFGYWDADTLPDFLLSAYDGTVALFRGVFLTGVEESQKSELRREKAGPTIVRGVLFLPEARSELRDITGRRVLDLRPGTNDVSRIAPGVYFVAGAVGQPAARVVIQR
jgi:hypothetical protein